MGRILGRGGDTAVDPVCKMRVITKNPPGGTSQYQGQTYYFCSPGCKRSFDRDPQQFLSGGGTGGMEHGQH